MNIFGKKDDDGTGEAQKFIESSVIDTKTGSSEPQDMHSSDAPDS
jgi:hypothetical protein